MQVVQKDGKLMIQQDDDTDKNLAEQFSFGEAGKIILYIPKDNAFSLAINNGSPNLFLQTGNHSRLCCLYSLRQNLSKQRSFQIWNSIIGYFALYAIIRHA